MRSMNPLSACIPKGKANIAAVRLNLPRAIGLLGMLAIVAGGGPVEARRRASNTNTAESVQSDGELGGPHPRRPEPRLADQRYTVVLEFKPPYREHADAFLATTGIQLWGRIRQGSLSAELTRRQVRDLLGLTIRVSVVRGAGNRTNADAYFATIPDPGALKEEFKPLLRRVWINTDPKREVGEGEPEYRPRRKPTAEATPVR